MYARSLSEDNRQGIGVLETAPNGAGQPDLLWERSWCVTQP